MADLGLLVDSIEERSGALSALGYRVRFDLTDGGGILLDATGGTVAVSIAEEGEADAVMRLSSDNLLKLVEAGSADDGLLDRPPEGAGLAGRGAEARRSARSVAVPAGAPPHPHPAIAGGATGGSARPSEE